MIEDEQEKKDLFFLKIFIYFWIVVLGLNYIFPYGRSSGPSMLPTAEDRSYYMSIKHYYNFFEPNYGDIISFDENEISGGLVKRIIGLPGDLIEIIDNNLYINQKKIKNTKIEKQFFTILEKKVLLTIYKEEIKKNKSYNILKNKYGTDCVNSRMDTFEKVYVPKNHYFVLGDNRFCSGDSREFGSIKKSKISEKILFFYKPKSYQSWDWE